VADDTLKSVDVPDGMMRLWDPKEKKVVLGPAWATPSDVTLVVRVHDPREKNPALSACWAKTTISRSDLVLSAEELSAKYVIPLLKQLKNLKVT